MSPPHHYSLSHPTTKRHVKYPSDSSRRSLPLTPPLTPSSSINASKDTHTVPPANNDTDTRIILLTNLSPTLDPSVLEHTIHQILSSPSRIKGLNTRSLSTTHAVPVVFFDSRDARSVFDSVSSGTPLLDSLAKSPDGPVGAEMISVNQLVKDIGPSSFLDSIDPSFHLRVHVESPTKQLNIPMLQSLLSSFGELRDFTPEMDVDAENHLYHIEYFDSRDEDRAIHELDGKVFFGMTLAVVRGTTPQRGDLWDEHEGLKNVEFPSISTAASSSYVSASVDADANTCEKPEVADSTGALTGGGIRMAFGIGPPGSASNLRVRFRSLGEGAKGKHHIRGFEDADAGVTVTADVLRVSDASSEVEDDVEVEVEAKPTVLYASSSAPALPFPLPLGSVSLLSDASLSGTPTTGTGMDPPLSDSTPPSSQWDAADPPSSSSSSSTTSDAGPEGAEASTKLETPTGPHTPTLTTPDGICIYCPSSRFIPTASASNEGAHYPPPPPMPMSAPPPAGALTPVVASSYAHYGMPQNVSDPGMPAAPSDSGMVYYPSLTPAPAHTPPMATGYEYLESQYGANMTVMQGHHGHTNMAGSSPSAPGWGTYDPSMMMPMGMNMNMGMGMVPLPMGINMNMNVGMNMGMPPPHTHGYYEGPGSGGAGRGYVVPYGHPPHPHPQSQSQYQTPYGVGVNMNGAGGVYGHLQSTQQQQYPNQNQRFAGGEGGGTPSSLTSRSGSGSSVGSSCQSMGSGGGGGRVNGSYAYRQGRGTPPPLTGTGAGRFGLGKASFRGLGYKDRDTERERDKDTGEGFCLGEHQQQRQQQQNRQRGCSCSRNHGDRSSPAPGSTSLSGGVHYDDDDDVAASLHIPPSAEPTDLITGTSTSSTTTPLTAPSERNQLNIKRIEEGLDTRTTVMIKNIPNKMSDRDLMAFIERVCPRRIDFFYLRMDFQNGCNVGYAFVNFIHVQDLLRFAKARLGVKWNMFSSEKVLQMSYANYQGKEALVEKFKNSAIMDEREAWRPRIFYSSGQGQGLPEPFPPPTHMRRKERSFFNRGALFVPGSGVGGSGGEGKRGMRLGGGKDGTEGLLTMRGLSGLTFGKSWMGRTTTTRNGAGVASDLEEGEEEMFGGV